MVPIALTGKVEQVIRHVREGGDVSVVSRYGATGERRVFLATVRKSNGVSVVIPVLEIGMPDLDVVAPPADGRLN